MNSLELVRRLYEGEIDVATLEKELDEDARQELRQLVEAKEALEAMPRRKPPQRVVDLVVAEVSRVEAPRSPLTLILTNRTLQRMAAAAIVVVAVGIGYLTLRTDDVIPVDMAGEMSRSSEAPALAEEHQVLGGAEMEDRANAPSESPGRRGFDEAKSSELPAPGAPSDEDFALRSGDLKEAGAIAQAEPLQEVETDMFGKLDREASFADSSIWEETAETHDLLSWDQEEEALRTFFWQVRALDRRSPGDDWEEAVPLEGSFERLEKQQPGRDRWLQTGSQR